MSATGNDYQVQPGAGKKMRKQNNLRDLLNEEQIAHVDALLRHSAHLLTVGDGLSTKERIAALHGNRILSTLFYQNTYGQVFKCANPENDTLTHKVVLGEAASGMSFIQRIKSWRSEQCNDDNEARTPPDSSMQIRPK